MTTSSERLEELRRLALASDVEITTDPAELTRRSIEEHVRSVAMESKKICGVVGRAAVACTKPPGHEPPHDWSGMNNPEQTLICGKMSPGGILCSYLEDHLGGHSWNPDTDQRSRLADDDRRAIADTYARYRDAMSVGAFVPWRVGRTNACNVYAVTGIAANWKDDTPIACFTVPELAIQACDDHNHRLDARIVR